MSVREVVLPRRAVPQPVPAIVEGGDCGACAIGGLTGIPPAQVYRRLRRGRLEPLDHIGMAMALLVAQDEGLVDRVISDVPIWPWATREEAVPFGLSGEHQVLAWWNYLRMGLDAGYYGIAEVSHRKAGPAADTDHVVLLCGVRDVVSPVPGVKGATETLYQVLVSCSSRSTPGEEWVDADAFLRERGGFNVLLARPAGGDP